MINLNASLWDRIALLADIPESFPLYKYIKIENKMFAEARSLEESPVKTLKDLREFTILRVALGEVYKYLSENDCTTGLDLITVKEEDIKAKGLFTSIKGFYEKSKNSKSVDMDNIEKFIYPFVSEHSGKDISNNRSKEEDYGYLNLSEKKEKIALRYRNDSNGSSLFELVKNTDLFGLNLNKYIGSEDEIYVYKFLYLLFSLFELEHNNTNFCLLIEKLEEMHPKLSLINFRNNLHDYQDILFSNKEALEYLICNLGGEPEDISRTLCFYYAMEQYSLKNGQKDSTNKRKGGILLFNILRNPGLEAMPAYVINKKEIENTSKLPAFYTKYGYYLDNIIKECAKYETLNTKDLDNTYQNKVRVINCALQFLIKKAFLSLTAQPVSSEDILVTKISEVNMQLKALLEKIAVSKDHPHGKLFDAVVFRLESAIQIGKSHALQAAREVIEEWLQESEVDFVSAPDLSAVGIDDISTYLKSEKCKIFSIYNYNETDRSKLRDGADFIQKAATAYCENSLYENYNYKRNEISLCELDAICYAYLNGFFKKKVRCHGYTLNGTSESREIKTVIEDLDKNISKNSNNFIYYFTFLNTLINRIAAKRGLYEQVYNVASNTNL